MLSNLLLKRHTVYTKPLYKKSKYAKLIGGLVLTMETEEKTCFVNLTKQQFISVCEVINTSAGHQLCRDQTRLTVGLVDTSDLQHLFIITSTGRREGDNTTYCTACHLQIQYTHIHIHCIYSMLLHLEIYLGNMPNTVYSITNILNLTLIHCLL